LIRSAFPCIAILKTSVGLVASPLILGYDATASSNDDYHRQRHRNHHYTDRAYSGKRNVRRGLASVGPSVRVYVVS